MSTPTFDLFDPSSHEPQGERPETGQQLATVSGAGLPPEWGAKAIDAVFAGRKERVKALDPTARVQLIKALWVYAVARHEALLARRSAAAATLALLGHRNAKDELAQALRFIEMHGITPSDIPPAKEFAPVDLRSIAGDSPFPLPTDAPDVY